MRTKRTAQTRLFNPAPVDHPAADALEAKDMTPSSWLYDQLKRFCADIEAGISYLKRCFGLARFKAYVHSAIFGPDARTGRCASPFAVAPSST